MSIPGQPPPSPVLRKAIGLLEAGKFDEAEEAVRTAALTAKAQFGTGSHELARGYGDMARIHYRLGDLKKAAAEFKHACDGPMPPDAVGRADRLAFMFGFAACLEELDRIAEAEKVYRQCVVFARNLHGPGTAGYAASLEPLARLLLKSGLLPEAIKLADESYTTLWNLGDRQITAVIGTRAEALKAAGRRDNPFTDLADLPDEMVTEAVANVVCRAGNGDEIRIRKVLADLLQFLDRKYGEGHPLTMDAVAAIAHHEAKLGDAADHTLRARAMHRAVWAYVRRRAPAGLLAGLEIGFETGGTIHLVPRLSREPSPDDVNKLEYVLTQAVDQLYARSPSRSR